jgi:hypothetical protein
MVVQTQAKGGGLSDHGDGKNGKHVGGDSSYPYQYFGSHPSHGMWWVGGHDCEGTGAYEALVVVGIVG